MKKRRSGKALLALLLSAALLPAAGCSQNPDALTLMKTASEEMQKLDSYAADATLEFNMGVGDGESTINMGMNGTISIEMTQDPFVTHGTSEVTVRTLGQEDTTSSEYYQFEQDGELVQLTNDGSGWVSQSSGEIDVGTAQDAMKLFDYDIVKDLEPAVTGSEKVNDVDAWRIEFEAGIEELMALSGEEMDSTTETFINAMGEDITLKCVLYVDKETNRYVKSDITLSGLDELFRLAMSSSELPEGMELTMDDIVFSFTYGKFNEVDAIEIPSEVANLSGGGGTQTNVWETMKLNVGSASLTIGESTVQELLDAGFTLDSDLPETMEPGDTQYLTVLRGEDDFSLSVENMTSETIDATDATVYGFSGMYIAAEDIVLEGGIHSGSTSAEVLEAYGDPNTLSDEGFYDKWKYEISDTFGSKYLDLAIEDGVVTDIDLSVYYFGDLFA